ncbi:MAG: hypothetical protein ACOYZ8_16050 [Chloroflexota bacterium]
MSTARKTLVLIPLLVFVLACGLITGPIDDAKNVAATAAALGTQAVQLATQAAPLETLIANPSALPDIPGDIGNMLDPQGAPAAVWNEIPIMPQAVAGQEIQGLYSFKASATAEEATAFYTAQLPPLGWNEEFVAPEVTPVLFYTKNGQSLTITITPAEGGVVVWLALQ